MNHLRFTGFDWDEGNSAKCQAHGMTLAEVESLFAGTPLVGPDPFDPSIERRWRAIGRAGSGRLAFVVFTVREEGDEHRLRPISARYMHAKEARKYAEEQDQG